MSITPCVVLVIDDNPYGLAVALRINLRSSPQSCWTQGCKMEKTEYNDEDGVEDEREKTTQKMKKEDGVEDG